jgi:hypothetical protein
MINESLEEYYRMNAVLQREWEYSLTELEEMFPFEREVYTSLLLQHLQEQKNKQTG